MRRAFLLTALLLHALVGVGTYLWAPMGFLFGPLVALTILGLVDMFQKKQTIRRNFPVIGHGRYLLETLRPELNQYFVESNTDGMPFSRETRSLVYQRAKRQLDTLPFGTQLDLYEVGMEWLTHSMNPAPKATTEPRVWIGEKTCKHPYSASLLNISAMSYGALSKNAILALSRGAKKGGFAHNTGEGGISPYHLEGGADLIWQVGTGYFGCRNRDGSFDPERFKAQAASEAVKMVEIKISQGAKPGHGGILPGQKVTLELAEIRGVPMGQDVLSPPGHSEFSTPIELLDFVSRVRELSGDKPVGVKLCIGKRREFLAVCKAMVTTGQHPDYIAVDGAEGGTGAAPVEFSNRLGMPLTDAVVFAHNALVGIGFRDRVKLFASGKVVSGFHMARLLAIGADACYSARAMMMAIGCIQARRCNSNACPTGVATQDPRLVHGLVVEDKAERTYRYHAETLDSFLHLLAACGFRHPHELMPYNVHQRVSPTEVKRYSELYEYLEPGSLLAGTLPRAWGDLWQAASAETFADEMPFPSKPPPQ